MARLNKYAREVEKSAKNAEERRQKSKAVKNVIELHKLNRMSLTQAERALEAISGAGTDFANQLTMHDIKKFNDAHNKLDTEYKALKHKGGISAKGVIGRSLRIDIDRAQKEIPTARPVSIDLSGVCKFWVSASPQSKDTSHYVAVQFLNFPAVLTAEKITGQIVDLVVNGALKYDCDCGRHQYWYRYLASVGKFNYGQAETRFPKVRNPSLRGLGCKHVIRVMSVITKSAAFRDFIRQQLVRLSASDKKEVHVSLKAQKELVKKVGKESWQGKKIRRTAESKIPFKVSGAFDLIQKISIKGRNIKPIEISRALMAEKSGAQRLNELKSALSNAGLNKLSKAQIKAIQVLIEKG